MRIVLLSGIWPPDVGGPATHGPDLARFLCGRGHAVRVVTMGDRPPTELPCPVETVMRSRPFPIRYGLVAAKGARAARLSDLVYASATYAAAAAAATFARRPLVVKLVSDPAYERAYRLGLFTGSLEDFGSAAGAPVAALRRARTVALSAARVIVVPSEYLAGIARSWWIDTDRVLVVPNPAPQVEGVPKQAVEPGTFVFAGRLTAQKALGTALDAVASVPGARLHLVGDGPERARLEEHARLAGLNGRVVFMGARPRAEVLAALAGAYAAVLSSDWENMPHAALEALAVGTPVVATAVGGVPEVVHDGVNGLLVPAGSPEALAAALGRLLAEPELRDRLAAGARPSVASIGREDVYERLESILQQAVSR